jgi:hypothetical protein
MKMKARADQDNLILEEDDKTREVIMEHRILPTDNQNKWNGFWIGIKESVVKSETKSWTPITMLKRVHFQFSCDAPLKPAQELKKEREIKNTKIVCPQAMTIFTVTGMSYT